MASDSVPFASLLKNIVDNRGKTCPIAESGIPLIATNCVKNELLYPSYESVRFVDEHTYATWFRGHPLPGDFLFVTKGSPGRVAVVPDPVDFCIAQDMVAIRADREKVYPLYLFALLRSREVQERIEQLHVGTMIPHFKKGDFDKLLLAVPDRRIQEFIGNCYFAFSSKIDLNRKINETLEAMARALFKSWFVDFDPVRAKAEGRDPGLPAPIAALFPDSFEDSELGEIPKGWQIMRLDSVCENIFSGGTPSTTAHDYWDGNIPWLSSGETRAKFIISTEKFITLQGVEKSSTRLARAGATVIASAGQGNTRGQTSMLMFDAYINQSVVALLPNRLRSSDVHLFFDLERRYEEFRRISDGHSSRGSLTTKLLGGLTVVLPPLEIVREFDMLAEPMVRKITCALRESQALAALRDSLLPKLISGELRVGKAAELVEAAI